MNSRKINAGPNKSLQLKFKLWGKFWDYNLTHIRKQKIMANELRIPTRDAARWNFVPKTTSSQILRKYLQICHALSLHAFPNQPSSIILTFDTTLTAGLISGR